MGPMSNGSLGRTDGFNGSRHARYRRCIVELSFNAGEELGAAQRVTTQQKKIILHANAAELQHERP